MDSARLLLLLQGDSAGALAAIGETEAGLKSLGEQSTKTNGMLASAAGAIVKLGEVAAVAGAVVAGVSVKMAADLQTQMTLVRTQAHDTTDNMQTMTSQVIKMSTEVGISADKLAQGLYHVTSVGYRGADAMNILKIAAEGARVGNADLDSTTYALTSTMNTYGLGAKDAAGTMATLNAIVGAGDMRFQDLNAAISTGFLAAGETFGVSIQSMGAALAYLTDRGASADESATRLKMSITLLGAPTSKSIGILKDLGLSQQEATDRATAMEEALKKSGVSVTQLSDDLRKPDGIKVALQDLVDHMHKGGLSADEMAAVLSRAFGGGRSGAAIMSMTQHLDILGQKFDMVNAGAARFGQDWEDTTKTFNFQLDRLRTNVEALGLRLGITLLPILTNVVKYLADNMGVVTGWADALGKMGSGIEGVLRSFGIGVSAPTRQAAGEQFRSGERTEQGGWGPQRSTGEMFRAGERGEMGSSGVTTEAASAAAGKQAAEMAKRIATALSDAFKEAVRTIDWAGLGREVARDALAFMGAFLDNLGWAGEVARWLIGAFVALRVAMAVGWVLEFASAFRVVAAEQGAVIAVTRALGLEYIGVGINAVRAAFVATVAWMSARVETAAIAGMYAMDWIVANVKVAASFLAARAQAVATFLSMYVTLAIGALRYQATAVASFIAVRVAAIASAIAAAAAWVAQNAIMLAATMRTVAGMILLNAWTWIVRGATLIWTAAQWLLNVALTANPIGLVIIAIALLVAGIIWAYNNVGWFHDAVNKAWKLLQEFGGWVQGVLWPVIVTLADKFAETTGRMVDSAKSLASSLIDHIGGGLNAAIGLFRGFIDAINGILGHFGIEGIKVEGTLKTGIDLGAAKKAIGLATGGMVTNGPYLIGEGDPAHPEFVIPSDPKFKSRAKSLLHRAIQAIGLAEGGTIPTSGSDGECVEFAEQYLGVHWPVGAAKELVRYMNSDTAKPGEAAVFTAGPYGHVAIVTGTESGGGFPVVDSNWVGHHQIGTHVMNRGQYGFAGFIDVGKPLGTLAGGGGGVGFNPLGLIDGAVKAAQGALGNLPEWIRGLSGAILGKMVDGVKGKLLSSFAGRMVGTSGTSSGSHADWLHAAEQMAGVGTDWDQGLSIIIEHEGGWRSDARNATDSNAQAGNASVGLMQLTGSNRARYDPDESPVGQIVGGIKYILARYGGIGNVPGVRSVLSGGSYVPYDAGGLLPPGLTLAYNGTGRSEVVSPAGAGGMAELVAEQRRTNAYLHAILHDQNAPAGGYAANLRAG